MTHEKRAIMKQPRALVPLFATELWERYGFYIVQGLLIFFLVNHLNFSDDHAYTVLGQFSALVYISPIIGGFLADRYLGFRYAILIGAILLCLGYIIVSTTVTSLIYWGLAVVIMGNGFLKANISSYLGEFYSAKDPRRDAGFTIFYIGINLGVIISTTSSGFIQREFGWHVVFATAAIGMMIAIISFLIGFKHFAKKGLPIAPQSKNIIIVGTTIVAGTIISLLLLTLPNIGSTILMVFGLLLLGYLLIIARTYKPAARMKIYALIIMIIVSIIFWALYFQIFFSMNLFVERSVNRHLFGINIPPVAFISLESFFIIALGFPTAKLWKYLAKHNCDLSYQLKFTLALVAVVLTMLTVVCGIVLTNGNGLVNPWWLVLTYFFLTVGELLLSPIGLAMVTKLAPKGLIGMMMGVWFMALGFGSSLAGYLAKFAAVPKDDHRLSTINPIYLHAYGKYAVIAGVFVVVMIALSPLLNKLISPEQNTPSPTHPV